MSRRRQLTAKEVKTIAKKLGFRPRPGKGTSHEQWVRDEPPPFRKITIDCHLAPFSDYLIGSMARQAGLSVSEFYRVLDE